MPGRSYVYPYFCFVLFWPSYNGVMHGVSRGVVDEDNNRHVWNVTNYTIRYTPTYSILNSIRGRSNRADDDSSMDAIYC